MDEEMKQKNVFLSGEGDSWFERNAAYLSHGKGDVVVDSLERLSLRPKSILEIGCANGHRLAMMAERYGAKGAGIDPSAKAISDGVACYPELDLRVGTADELPFATDQFDLVIFGFCLYLVDPALHFRAIAEADRVLRSPAILLTFDFIEPYPFHNNYSHLAGIRTHKMEWSRFFLASPAYRLVQRLPDLKGDAPLQRNNLSGVDILLKDSRHAFPANPFL